MVTVIHAKTVEICHFYKNAKFQKSGLATPAGLEPATLCLEGRCSIQLSYGAAGKEIEPKVT